MKTYRCKVSDNRGKVSVVTRQAYSANDAKALLTKEGFFPISIKPERKRNLSFRIRGNKLADFISLLSMLLDSGLEITDAVGILKTITTDKNISDFAALVEKKMQAGYTFSSAFEESISMLPSIYMLLLKTGEATGSLTSSFRNLTRYLARTKAMRDKLISSSIYPLFVLFTAFAGIVLISSFIIPRISELFLSLGTEIPKEVDSALSVSRGIFTFAGIIIPVFFLLVLIVHIAGKQNDRIPVLISRVKNRLPLTGNFIRDTQMLRIFLTLDTLVSCGISIEEALKMVSGTIRDTLYRNVLSNLRNGIIRGESLSKAMSREKEIPEKVLVWTAACERTGDPGSAFRQLASFYEKEIDRKASLFIGMVEPVLILVTGFLLFLMIVFIIIPLFNAFGGISL